MEKPMIEFRKIFKPFQQETSIEKAFLILSLLVTTGIVVFFAFGSSIAFRYIAQTVLKNALWLLRIYLLKDYHRTL